MQIQNNVFIITGGASGLGAATARMIVEAGGKVVLADVQAEAGQKLFSDLSCITCHMENAQGRGPVLKGLYGKEVLLASGQTVTMDDAYIRESVLHPQAKVVAGFQPIMPTFQGLVTEEQLLQIIAYVKSLK